ncbi:hypothetical protein HJ178_24320 [Vibrio parahaemolyticus]|nr:hypothetical protein [Vibrio parahaemolyticus]MBE3830731.1 hypothetical protein [Vibrio parahaemolyticus]MBE3986309.1 hypothetical protein [Vibrio parahaemolyticus]HCG7195351.1 hypothetical protein [Vibrio parahaemolyticus]
MVCKLCGEDKKLIEAHIIPRSFYEPLKESGKIPSLITDTAGIYPKRSPTGIYDKNIVCESCEQLFSPWDDYGYRFLSQSFSDKEAMYEQGELLGFNLGTCDYHKLKMFFLSLLWRASVSSDAFFKLVDLGPFEKKVAELIRTNSAGDNKNFSVALSKFESKPNETGMMNPHLTRIDNVLHYSFYLFNFNVLIKVSSETGPKLFKDLYIDFEKDVFCISRSFEESKEYSVLLNVVKNARTPKK